MAPHKHGYWLNFPCESRVILSYAATEHVSCLAVIFRCWQSVPRSADAADSPRCSTSCWCAGGPYTCLHAVLNPSSTLKNEVDGLNIFEGTQALQDRSVNWKTAFRGKNCWKNESQAPCRIACLVQYILEFIRFVKHSNKIYSLTIATFPQGKLPFQRSLSHVLQVLRLRKRWSCITFITILLILPGGEIVVAKEKEWHKEQINRPSL